MRKNQSGFADPLSLIAVGFLVVSLFVGAAVVKNRNTKLDVREKATVTLAEPCKVCVGTTCSTVASPPNCTSSENECSSSSDCGSSSSNSCQGTCYYGYSACSNLGRSNATGTCTGGICCGNLLPQNSPSSNASTPTPTPNYTCTNTAGQWCSPEGCTLADGACSGTGTCPGTLSCCRPCLICNRCSNTYDCKYASWVNYGTSCSQYNPSGSVTYTPSCNCPSISGNPCAGCTSPTPTPAPESGICCPKTNTAGAINTCKGILNNNNNACTNQSVCEWKPEVTAWNLCPALLPPPPGVCCPKDGSTEARITCKDAGQTSCTINSRLCAWESVGSWSQCPALMPTSSPTPTPSFSCSGTCRWGYTLCANGGWQNAAGTCPSGSICCGNPLPTSTPTPTPQCSQTGLSGVCASLVCCPGTTKIIGMYGSCQCKAISTPTPTYRCSTFGSCVPINYVCERNYGQLDCRDSQQCGVHCSAAVTATPTSPPTPVPSTCTASCRANPCCKCTTCDGNTASECSTVCNLNPQSTSTSTPTSTPASIPTPSPVSVPGSCTVAEQCPEEYTCLNGYCVSDQEIQQCVSNATLLANAAVGSNGITLDPSYVPPGLVDLEAGVPNAMYANYEILIQEDAVDDINCLVNGMIQNGYVPVISYGYRDYELQEQLHEAYGDQAATPGNSQHQTGLAFDIHEYASTDNNGNIQFFQACTLANTPECEATNLAISIAAQCGIAHPLGWDAPHFFDVSAACPGLESYVETIQNPTATYYDELNTLIAQYQQECLQGL